MPVFPGMYPAKVIKISNLNLQVLVPQVFGEAVVAVQRTLGGWPTSVGLGWVTFVAGNPEFPVWASGVSIAGPAGPAGEAGAPGGGVSQRNYTFDNRTTASDPGSGKLKTNNNDESLVTEVYASLYGAGGQVAPGIALLDTGDEFLLYESNDFGASVRYEITATPTITDNLWSLIPVTIVEYNGFAPTNNQDVVTFISTPPPTAPVNEVWIGTDDPIATNPTIELWYDTDAPSPAQTGVWQVWTPVLTQSAACVITVSRARYTRIGDTIIGNFSFTYVSGGTPGQGIAITRPVPGRTPSPTITSVGTAYVSMGAPNGQMMLQVVDPANVTVFEFIRSDIPNIANYFGVDPSITLVGGNVFSGSFMYEGA